MLYLTYFGLLAFVCWCISGVWFGEPLVRAPRRKLTQAEIFNRWLQSWQLLGTSGGALSQLAAVPSYKFFGRLAEEGLRQARTFGSFPRELIWEWRDGVAREKAFDERTRSIRISAYLQFVLFTVITWVLVHMTKDVAGNISPAIYLVMLLLQLGGSFAFAPVLAFSQKQRLAGFSELLESLYVLRTLSAANLPTSKVISEARLESLAKTKNAVLVPLRERVEELARLYQKQGGALGREAQILLQEVWFLREEGMNQLAKTAEGLKLIFLLCFYAGPYFIFLAALMFEVLQTS
ncbi:MAG: hypothetical protein ACLGG7_06970 [Bacteriovoracia bacterium]